MTDDPQEAQKAPEPAIWGLIRPDGSVDSLVGTKGDCEVWVAAKSERRSGWRVVPLNPVLDITTKALRSHARP